MGIDIHKQIKPAVSWEVHQATGMIIAQTASNADDALDRLVDYAQSTGASVDQVAADILASRIKLG